MKLVGKLNHPRIVKAYDAGEVEGIPYLAMELVEGIDLSTLVKRGGTLAIEDACEVIRQAAEGLQYIHKQGLVHRDIKPSNLMLTTHGEVKILDLGLAQIRMQGDDEELTRSGQVMGTLDYMAPEQALDSSKVDHRADIYSLGVTFYKLLTGATPFDRKNFGNPLQKTRAMLNEESPAVSVNRPDFPVELDLLVKRMLVRNPEDRCADLREIENLLAPFARAHTLSSLVDVSCREEDQTRIRQTAERGAKGLGWKIFTFALVILVIAGFWIESHWFPGNSVISPEENPERAQSENSSPEISKSNFKDSPISGMESRFTEMGLYWLVPDQADLPLKPLQLQVIDDQPQLLGMLGDQLVHWKIGQEISRVSIPHELKNVEYIWGNERGGMLLKSDSGYGVLDRDQHWKPLVFDKPFVIKVMNENADYFVGFDGPHSLDSPAQLIYWTPERGLSSTVQLPDDRGRLEVVDASSDGKIVIGMNYVEGSESRAYPWQLTHSGLQVMPLPVSSEKLIDYRVTSVSANGQFVAGSVRGKTAFVWDRYNDQLISDEESPRGEVIALSNDGMTVVANGAANRSWIWRPGQGFDRLVTFLHRTKIDYTELTYGSVLGISADSRYLYGTEPTSNSGDKVWIVDLSKSGLWTPPDHLKE